MKKLLPALLLGTTCFAAGAFVARPAAPDDITVAMLRAAQQLLGLSFTDAQLDSTRRNLTDYRENYEALRKIPMPNTFRSSRFIPAVEYLQAQRVRSLLIEQLDAQLQGLDAYLAPSFSASLVLTNLTGHPAVAMPNGFTAAGLPSTITFIGQLYKEGTLLALAKAYQDATEFDEKHPTL